MADPKPAPSTPSEAPAATVDDVLSFIVDDFAPPKRQSSARVRAELARFEDYVLSTPAGRTRIFPYGGKAGKTWRSKLSRACTRLEKSGRISSKKHYKIGVTTATDKQAKALNIKPGVEICYIHNGSPASAPLPQG